ncbi:Transcriptional regulator, TetR family protein [Lachnospiraceae bacterium TWA4]|nr:Transcriptional regulator, TetR family protein [Lachnospiraceae bacterium TWA4]
MFVDATYRILKEEGPEGIKIRRLANELNCTSTVIYRYFENLDHLVALASIRFLEDYIVDFRNLVNNPQIVTDPYGLNIKMWNCLAKYAFKEIPIYENLFL